MHVTGERLTILGRIQCAGAIAALVGLAGVILWGVLYLSAHHPHVIQGPVPVTVQPAPLPVQPAPVGETYGPQISV